MLEERRSPKVGFGGCELLVGTSGYSYAEWTTAGFYPKGTQPARMLAHYAGHFPISELNNTWYQMPRADAMERLMRLVPDDFLFCAKLTRGMTHDVEPSQWKAQVKSYRDGVSPLMQTGRLVATLAQFPQSFTRSAENRKYLASLIGELEGMPLALEFRHASWADHKVYEELARRRVTLVSVDAPDVPGLFPCVTEVTNPDLIYARFHGRNAKGWRGGGMQAQFNYDYSDDELEKWLDDKLSKMAQKARRGVIFFNNHVAGQAPNNARRLTELLRKAGMAE